MSADADRYRWLRDEGSLTWVPFRSQWRMTPEQCDAAIDRERALQALHAKSESVKATDVAEATRPDEQGASK